MLHKSKQRSWAKRWAESVTTNRRKSAYRQKSDVDRRTTPEQLAKLLEEFKLIRTDDGYAVHLSPDPDKEG